MTGRQSKILSKVELSDDNDHTRMSSYEKMIKLPLKPFDDHTSTTSGPIITIEKIGTPQYVVIGKNFKHLMNRNAF